MGAVLCGVGEGGEFYGREVWGAGGVCGGGVSVEVD